MMRFYLAASGSKGNCFILKNEGTVIQIDCGTTKKYLTECFRKIRHRIEDTDALLITHDHSDHISQIRMFKELSIYSPVEIDGIDTFTVRPLQSFTVESLKITPLALSHDAMHTTGYIFESGEEKLTYITDTGYVNEKYFPLIRNSDYIILESNHDPSTLMNTRRPYFLKQRIIGEEGHLCNEDCAEILKKVVSENTKMIILAHISQEANTREMALHTSADELLRAGIPLHQDLMICAAGQFEMIGRGGDNEKVVCGSVSRALGMERMAYIQNH